MLVALVRPRESCTVTVEGKNVTDLRGELAAQVPAGWELVSAHATMKAGGIRTVEGRYERRDGTQEIEADDMTALEAKVPDGWQMLSVRST
ncbi:hypothetical protein [Microbacterium aurantiacum]|uniref:hypothetical protein n=1 Tax=Microbacterium aurantiacum TaxID=162393 RepID=UPI000C80251F|nr:hypothetical protein [Microbacterium aurantiacum]